MKRNLKIKNVWHPRKMQCSRTHAQRKATLCNVMPFGGTADRSTIAFREIERKQSVRLFSRWSLKQRTDFGPCEQTPEKDTVRAHTAVVNKRNVSWTFAYANYWHAGVLLLHRKLVRVWTDRSENELFFFQSLFVSHTTSTRDFFTIIISFHTEPVYERARVIYAHMHRRTHESGIRVPELISYRAANAGKRRQRDRL